MSSQTHSKPAFLDAGAKEGQIQRTGMAAAADGLPGSLSRSVTLNHESSHMTPYLLLGFSAPGSRLSQPALAALLLQNLGLQLRREGRDELRVDAVHLVVLLPRRLCWSSRCACRKHGMHTSQAAGRLWTQPTFQSNPDPKLLLGNHWPAADAGSGGAQFALNLNTVPELCVQRSLISQQNRVLSALEN